MTIAWQHFTPWASLAGGMLIGLAAALLILFNGRIAGISGILGGLLRPRQGDLGWRIAFLAGLIGTPLLCAAVASLAARADRGGHAGPDRGGLAGGRGRALWRRLHQRPRRVRPVAPVTPFAGGHLAFMAAGFLTVYLLRHSVSKLMSKLILSLLSGLVFGLGLIVSGMSNPAKVLGFLDLAGAWDPSLALVMGGAIGVAMPAFWLARRRSTALLGEPMQLPASRRIDRRLLLGSLAFGAGWGIAGFCPGPALVSLLAGQPKAWIFVAAMLAGMALFEVLERRKLPAPA